MRVIRKYPFKNKVSKALVQRCSVKKIFLKLLQNSMENTCARVFFNKVTGLRPATLLKKRLWQRCFSVNFAKILRTPLMAASKFSFALI